ncbi:hypothetical protein INR49_018276 [Caranx melampygus]|nr:hypothetical protein INR49_018276 [Caranx melampygus]
MTRGERVGAGRRFLLTLPGKILSQQAVNLLLDARESREETVHERSNFYPTPLQQTNVYTTTYYPTALGKFDYQPNSSPSPCRTYNHSNNS